MMQLRNLFITLIMLAGIRFSAENDEYMEVWKPEVKPKCFLWGEGVFTLNLVNEMHCCLKEGYVVAPFYLQQDLVNFPDYDVLQDPADSTQNHGKVYFSQF